MSLVTAPPITQYPKSIFIPGEALISTGLADAVKLTIFEPCAKKIIESIQKYSLLQNTTTESVENYVVCVVEGHYKTTFEFTF